MVLEGLCAARAAERITEAEITELAELGDAMRAAVQDGDVPLYQQLNQRVHARVQEISGQKTVSALIRRLQAQNMVTQCQITLRSVRQQSSLAEHLAIIEAVSSRDPDKARSAAEEHMRNVMAVTSAAADSR
jgi:DNA-binding GntR family transcriptional regulator